MKYFEFNTGGFPYYALIAANSVEDAKICYILYVYELNDFDGEPTEITEEEAVSTLNLCYVEMDEDNQVIPNELKTELEIIKLAKEPYLLMIDYDLFDQA